VARPKKKPTKSKKKAKKGTAAVKGARRKQIPARLTVEEKQTKLKPGDDLNELIDETLTAWSLVARRVRVGDVSRAKLASLGKKAQKAQKREEDLAAKQAAKLAPLSDARIVANDAAYRAVLKVKRVADAVAASDTAVADAFAAVNSRFRRMPKPEPAAAPAEG
jgi:hypothetical protein